MNSFISLIKNMYKNSSGIGVFNDNDPLYKKILILILLAVAFIPLICMIYIGTGSLYDLYSAYEMQNMIIIMSLCGLSLIIIFFGIFYALGILYFSKDIENYLYLPIKPWKILSGKMVIALLYEYLTLSVMYFPIMISFGMKDSWGGVQFISAVVIFIMLPIIPLTISTLFVMILMRFSNISKRKDSLKFVVSLIVLVILLGMNFGMSSLFGDKSHEILMSITENKEAVVKIAQYVFPPAVFGAKGIISTTLSIRVINLSIYVGLSVGAYFLLVLFGQKLYLKGVIGLSETGANRKALSDSKFKNESRQKMTLMTYAFKEIKILFRVPAYLFNCIVSEVIIIALIIVPVFFKNSSMQGLEQVVALIRNSNTDLTILVIFCVSVLLSAINAIAITAISREGEQFYVMKYLPIPYMNQIVSKVIAATIIGEFFNIVLITTLAVALKLKVEIVVIALIVSILGAVLSSFIGVIIDLHLPKLNWDTEQKLIKQNMNVLINLGLCGGVAVGLSYLLFNWGGKFMPIPILLVLVVVALILIMYRFLKVNIADRIDNINV